MGKVNVLYAEPERKIPEGMGAIFWGVSALFVGAFFAIGAACGYVLRGCM